MKTDKNNPNRYKMRSKSGVLAMSLLLLIVFWAAIRLGSSKMSAETFISALFDKSGGSSAVIIHSIRIPRAVAAIIAGCGLSVSGVLLQTVTGNQLASPNIIGVNSGAGLAVILTLSVFPSFARFTPLSAFIGAFLTTVLIVAAAGKVSRSKGAVILAGIAFTSLLNAAISFVSLIDTDALVSYNYFSIGGLSGAAFDKLIIPGIMVAICLTVSLLFAGKLDVMCLGDEMAAALGIRVLPLRILCMLLASASAAAVVSFAGLLGFVGLVVPHIARKLVGENIRYLLLVSAVCGAALVCGADLLGRVLLAPTEVPVGIVMAFIGAPFFIWLLLRKREY